MDKYESPWVLAEIFVGWGEGANQKSPLPPPPHIEKRPTITRKSSKNALTLLKRASTRWKKVAKRPSLVSHGKKDPHKDEYVAFF